MAFNTIDVGTDDTPREFEQLAPGLYALSGTTFASPRNEIRITPGKIARNGTVTFAITRVSERDVVENGNTVRKNSVTTITCTVPADGSVPAAQVNSHVQEIGRWLTPGIADDILQGKS